MLSWPCSTVLLPSMDSQRGCCAFSGTDHAELFQENLRQQPSTWPWRSRRVVYQLNSEGYRAPEWSQCQWERSLVLMGCSWAFGVGVDEDQTIAHYLSAQQGRPVINVSQGGTSIRWTCDQLTVMLARGLRPGAVAVIWTETTRWPWYGTEGPDQARLSQALKTAHAMDEQHASMRAVLDITAFRQTCQLMAVPLAEATWNTHTAELATVTLLPNTDRARDCQHPGPASNRWAAKLLGDLLAGG